MNKIEFQAQQDYTLVSTDFNQTFITEIIITRKYKGLYYYKITKRLRGNIVEPIPKRERYQIPLPTEPKNWLVFKGHNLPMIVSPDRFYERENFFRFVTDEPEQLKSFIREHCMNPSIVAFAHIKYNCDSDYTGTLLFDPVRTMAHINLYAEREVFPGIYYATTQDGHTVLHNQKHYCASAYPYWGSYNYAVHIHHNEFHPGKAFWRSGYKTQKAASKGLLYHASRVFGIPVMETATKEAEVPAIL